MVKSVLNISIDTELRVLAKEKKMNISKICNEALKTALNLDIEGNDTILSEVEEKENKLKEDLLKMKAEISALEQLKDDIKRKKEQEEEDKYGKTIKRIKFA